MEVTCLVKPQSWEGNMTLKKFLEEKRKRRRDFLVGAGTLIALPFLESLYCKNIYAQSQAPLRVLFGMIWPGVDQVGYSNPPDSTLNVLNDISDYTVFHTGLETPKDANNRSHPHFCEKFGFGDGRNSFNVYAAEVAGNGALPGLLNVGFDHEASHGGYRFLKKNGSNLDLHHKSLKHIASEAINIQNNGVVTNPITNQPMVVQLDKPTRLKKLSLDYVVDGIKSLQTKLSPSDKRLLDEHLTQIENIEKKLPRDPATNPDPEPNPDPVQQSACKGVNASDGLNWLQKHDLMVDIISQSFICDSRRVISIISNNCREHVPYHTYGNQFPNWVKLMHAIKSQNVTDRAGAENDTKPDYHLTTHFIQGGSGNAKMRAALSQYGDPENFLREVRRDVDKFNVNFYGRIARKLKETQDINGKSVLENSLIYFGGHMADATSHANKNLFSCTIGKGGGKINTSNKFDNHGSKNITNFQKELINKLKS